jgi:Rhs element Vgr protein
MTAVTATLLSGGEKIKGAYALLSIDVRRELNRVPRATLLLADGDAAEGRFPMSEAPHFEPGTEVEVRLRYEAQPDKEVALFKGPVVRHGIEAGPEGSLLRVELYDKAVKLTQGRRSAVFSDQTEEAMLGKVVEACGLTSDFAETGVTHQQMVQFNATGWDFIVSRAEANGHWVLADEGKVSTVDPKKHKPPATHPITYGEDVYELEFEADARGQHKEVKASGWDPAQQKPTEPAQGAAFELAQVDFKEDALAAVAGKTGLLSDPVPFAPGELQAWADARVIRSRMALLRGRLSRAGCADFKLLDGLEIRRVGGRFEGKTLITGICHRVDVDGWRTDLQFGLSARAFAQEEDIGEAPAAGLLPPAGGLHIGVVADFKEDQDKHFRVQVVLPGIDPKKEAAVWARLAAPDAGKNRGWFFRPEPGDEVVVGFFNDDPRQPVILGGLFSSKNVLPESVGAPAKENNTRAIVSRSGTTLGFIDDDKGSVFIEMKSGARLLIDDSAKSIELSDQNGNQLKMDENGITLKTGKDLKLQADGNVEIKGAKVDIK